MGKNPMNGEYALYLQIPAKTVIIPAFALALALFPLSSDSHHPKPPSNPLTPPAVYLVGSHPNSPRNPHHAGASGGSNIGDIRNSPPVNQHVLYGAMVGGPLASDLYWDWRDDWVQNEVALDYNAMIPTLASMMVSADCGVRGAGIWESGGEVRWRGVKSHDVV